MDAPSPTATDAVGPTESAEGPQGFNEYPADSTPSEGISEGYGQEAEGATARYTTPSGVVGRGAGAGLPLLAGMHLWGHGIKHSAKHLLCMTA